MLNKKLQRDLSNEYCSDHNYKCFERQINEKFLTVKTNLIIPNCTQSNYKMMKSQHQNLTAQIWTWDSNSSRIENNLY
jgi:hypothetical protein